MSCRGRRSLAGLMFPLLGACLIGSGLAQAAIPAGERQALLDLYNSTNGAGWTYRTNWTGAAGTECSWFGVVCDTGNTTVTMLSIGPNNLVGTLPASLSNLTNLGSLAISANKLTGSIPPSIGSLTWLYHLALDNNQLSGPIPASVGNLTRLGVLELSNNHLSGQIPAELGNLTSLTNIRLFNNQLSGPIPASLGSLVRLNYLKLNSNQLSGAIPATIVNLTKLYNGASDLRWNALWCTDSSVCSFLYLKQNGGDWQGTQTIAPSDTAVTGTTATSVTLSWTSTPYTRDPGFYRVYASRGGGAYALVATTNAKTDAGWTVQGLASGTAYTFVVQTVTSPHYNNQSAVESTSTASVRAITSSPSRLRRHLHRSEP